MQLPNRDQLESSFAARFARLNGKLRHRLEDYLGSPPDIARVPQSFWQEVEDEMNRELAIVLLLIWSQSARVTDSMRRPSSRRPWPTPPSGLGR